MSEPDPLFDADGMPLRPDPLDHNGECIYCDEPALDVAEHAPTCRWRLAWEQAFGNALRDLKG